MVQKTALKRPSAAPGSIASSSSKWTPQGSKEMQGRAAMTQMMLLFLRFSDLVYTIWIRIHTYNIVGVDDTGLGGRFSLVFFAHDMVFF
jgi:hypothetical protein